jgi:hypothetical protein
MRALISEKTEAKYLRRWNVTKRLREEEDRRNLAFTSRLLNARTGLIIYSPVRPHEPEPHHAFDQRAALVIRGRLPHLQKGNPASVNMPKSRVSAEQKNDASTMNFLQSKLFASCAAGPPSIDVETVEPAERQQAGTAPADTRESCPLRRGHLKCATCLPRSKCGHGPSRTRSAATTELLSGNEPRFHGERKDSSDQATKMDGCDRRIVCHVRIQDRETFNGLDLYEPSARSLAVTFIDRLPSTLRDLSFQGSYRCSLNIPIVLPLC